MEVILIENIEKLGKVGDVVKVKDGYARNYLIPKKKVLRANKENLKVFEEKKSFIESEENKIVVIDNLLGENPLNLCLSSLYCVYLPSDDILNRTKYLWFVRLNRRQILESNTQAAKYFLLSYGKLSLR